MVDLESEKERRPIVEHSQKLVAYVDSRRIIVSGVVSLQEIVLRYN